MIPTSQSCCEYLSEPTFAKYLKQCLAGSTGFIGLAADIMSTTTFSPTTSF